MKKRIIGVLAVMLLTTAVTAYVFAGTRLLLEAELVFESATSNHVILNITNKSRQEIYISRDAYYIDEIGSPGSWNCTAEDDIRLGPGQQKLIDYKITEAVTHGDNSILSIFVKYENQWYLTKVGPALGLESYSQHN